MHPARHRARASLQGGERQSRGREPAPREIRGAERERRHRQKIGEGTERTPVSVLVENQSAAQCPLPRDDLAGGFAGADVSTRNEPSKPDSTARRFTASAASRVMQSAVRTL